MNREQYFEELGIALRREGFPVLPEQGGLLPVEWDGAPLCRVTEGAGVRYHGSLGLEELMMGDLEETREPDQQMGGLS